jgi:hypothetical protein
MGLDGTTWATFVTIRPTGSHYAGGTSGRDAFFAQIDPN